MEAGIIQIGSPAGIKTHKYTSTLLHLFVQEKFCPRTCFEINFIIRNESSVSQLCWKENNLRQTLFYSIFMLIGVPLVYCPSALTQFKLHKCDKTTGGKINPHRYNVYKTITSKDKQIKCGSATFTKTDGR